MQRIVFIQRAAFGSFYDGYELYNDDRLVYRYKIPFRLHFSKCKAFLLDRMGMRVEDLENSVVEFEQTFEDERRENNGNFPQVAD